jgi:hypothetical protein
MNEPKRTYAGETRREHRCRRCGERSRFERDVDERILERERVEGGVLTSEMAEPPDLDPPLLPTTYRCARCGHEQSDLPD